jgi:hypothetical protein
MDAVGENATFQAVLILYDMCIDKMVERRVLAGSM